MSGKGKERLIIEYMRENDGIIPSEGELVEYAMAKYGLKIFQLSNGMFYVRIKTENGRKRIGSMTKEGLLKKVEEYYSESKKTVEDIFHDAIERKYNDQEISDSSKMRYERAFLRFFHDDNNASKRIPPKNKKVGAYTHTDFYKEYISDLTKEDFIEFYHETLQKYSLRKCGIAEVKKLFCTVISEARKQKLTDISVAVLMEDMDTPKKLINSERPADDKVYFTAADEKKVFGYCYKHRTDYDKAIMLMFMTGMRVGEVSALRHEDIDEKNGCIYIHSTESEYQTEKGTHSVKVMDRAKTPHGTRHTAIRKRDAWIFGMLKTANPFGEFVFCRKDGRRATTRDIRYHLHKVCKAVGITPRGCHAIRRTYATTLAESGVNTTTIIAQMGHTSINTTYNSYIQDSAQVGKRQSELDEKLPVNY